MDRRASGCTCDCHEGGKEDEEGRCHCGCDCCALEEGSALQALMARDEILQAMYWLKGERLASEVTAGELLTFIGGEENLLRRHLEALAEDHLLEKEGQRFRLTAAGGAEGRRRFVEEFAPLMRQGHGECNDPDCPCHVGEPCLNSQAKS